MGLIEIEIESVSVIVSKLYWVVINEKQTDNLGNFAVKLYTPVSEILYRLCNIITWQAV